MSNARATPNGPSPAGRRPHPGARDQSVPSITAAPEPLAADQARRTKVYLLQMGVRLVCFLTAIFLAHGWVRWSLFALAIVLPYSAVLFANAGRDRVTYDTSPFTPQAPAELSAGAPESSSTVEHEGHRVVEHEDDVHDGPHEGSTDDGSADRGSTDEDATKNEENR